MNNKILGTSKMFFVVSLTENFDFYKSGPKIFS